jgi:hypothetical protein
MYGEDLSSHGEGVWPLPDAVRVAWDDRRLEHLVVVQVDVHVDEHVAKLYGNIMQI